MASTGRQRQEIIRYCDYHLLFTIHLVKLNDPEQFVDEETVVTKTKL